MHDDPVLLQQGGLAVAVSPWGGAILSARWEGVDFLAPTEAPGAASRRFGAEASFPLLPFGNRIGNNAFTFDGDHFSLAPNSGDPLVLHGDGWLLPWEIVDLTAFDVVLRCVQPPSAATPYAYEAVQAISVCEGVLDMSLAVTNRAAHALPFGIGHHPYFPRTPGTRLVARARDYWTERDGHLPGERLPVPAAMDFSHGKRLPGHWMNNAYDGWDGRARLEWPELDLSLVIDAEPLFGCFMVFSSSEKAGFFCFEPMTHLPNAHNMPGGGGLVRLEPGAQVSGRIRLTPAAGSIGVGRT